jgi:hypothetical protein
VETGEFGVGARQFFEIRSGLEAQLDNLWVLEQLSQASAESPENVLKR